MTRRRHGKRFVVVALAAALLTSGQLAAWSASPATHATSDARRVATERLQSDAGAGLRLTRGADGTVSFAGVAAGDEIANPAVRPSKRVRAAARSHLQRYGPAFGTTRPGHTFRVLGTARTASRQDTVRFQQSLGGVPVIGGEVVVAMRPDRQLGSVLATLSQEAPLPPAMVTRQRAARLARRAVAATVQTPRLPVTVEGRWVWDPRVLGAESPYGARGVWRFTVGDRVAVHREVLVDDATGAVLLDLEAHQEALDRVVCNRNNARGPETPCTSGFARTEGAPATGVADVDAAYENAGSVSTFYQAVGGVDLTDLIGVNVSGVKKLAATVRYCTTDSVNDPCPYPNAFWNGTQMYYGAGYAVADDVVGHEITHGVIEHNADLFYWGQSGAINESLADIMGEIVDHRSTLVPGDGTWPLGEDLPIGAIRNMSNPSTKSQPDRMTSALWDADTFGYFDNGGVHTNSGVGNKAAYLISQGGTFNGQTITGIDSDDALTRTAELYYDAIVRLTSGSDYANLADVLEQTCQDFVDGALHGFTQDHCTNVDRAITATQLRTTPTQAPQPADAPMTCPGGITPSLLFDSETGSALSPGATWLREGSNATSGHESWYSGEPSSTVTSSLTASAAVGLPAGQLSYLWFQHWRLMDYVGNTYYDGGTVEIDDVGDALGQLDASSLPWVNGPSQTLQSPNSGRRAFGGDSFGWIASRADLSAYAGRSLKPRFTMRTDSSFAGLGWWLEDVRIYTCPGVPATPGAAGGTSGPTPPLPPAPAPATSAATAVMVTGGLGKAVVTWQPPATNAAAVASYRVATGDTATTLPATERRAVLKALTTGKTYVFTVTPATNGGLAPATSVTAKGTKATLKVDKAAGKTVLRGKLAAGSTGLKGMVLKVLLEKKGRWIKIGKVKTTKGGKYTVRLAGTSRRTFRVRFSGALGLMGTESAKRRL